jgi:nucleoside-diphosphate-sugar epimerase
MKLALVTGSSGLIGSEVCSYFARAWFTVHGVDNNQRVVLFGPMGDTRWNQTRLERELRGFVHREANSCSILEAFQMVEQMTGRPQRHSYVAENRKGDHICYYSDLRKMRAHYPSWDASIGLEETVRQIVDAWQSRDRAGAIG